MSGKNNKKRIAIILSGCGGMDGSETHEAISLMIAIKNDQKITREELAALIDKNTRTVQRILNGLVSSGYLIRIGKNRFGYWEIIDK